MIRRFFALAMVVLLLAAFTLQGSAIMRCACSGELFLTGWQEVECSVEVESVVCDCCCEEVIVERGVECCWLVGVIPEFEMVAGATVQTPQPSVADFVPDFIPAISAEVGASEIVADPEEPDPPGISQRVVYGVFLV